jgi:hypothetical protein
VKKTTAALLLLIGMFIGFALISATATASAYRRIKTSQADDYLMRMRAYAYLQYKQADTPHAKKALTDYLQVIDWLRADKVRGMDNKLAFEAGLANLRLYRLSVAEKDQTQSTRYMQAAQAEDKKLGWNDVSIEHLANLIAARESAESEEEHREGTSPLSTPEVSR